ncbi:MAG: DUF1572 domain-containing protein, partial [Cytophagaceae bacterium]
MNDQLFLESARSRFAGQKALGDKTLAQLEGNGLHWKPNDSCNSIAQIVKHLHGNMLSRWTNFLTEDGEKEWRQRDAEFESGNETAEEILELWESGWAVLLETLDGLSAADLGRTVTIRTEPLSVTDAIVRQLTHYSYHVGQIVF